MISPYSYHNIVPKNELINYPYFNEFIKSKYVKHISFLPAEELSSRIGVKMHKRYNLPNNWTEDLIDGYFMFLRCDKFEKYASHKKYVKVEQFLYNKIIKINPSLNKFKHIYDNSPGDLIMGVTSRFNGVDIAMYIQGLVGYLSNHLFRDKLFYITKHFMITDYDIQYVMSPQSINKVLKRINGSTELIRIPKNILIRKNIKFENENWIRLPLCNKS